MNRLALDGESLSLSVEAGLKSILSCMFDR